MERALSQVDVLARILEFAAAEPAGVGSIHRVCKLWRECLSQNARLGVSVVRRKAWLDRVPLDRRLPQRLHSLTLCSTNARWGHVADVLTAQRELRDFHMMACFAVTLPTGLTDSRRLFSSLMMPSRLTTLTLADVSNLRWPVGVRLPHVEALALTNSSLVFAADSGGTAALFSSDTAADRTSSTNISLQVKGATADERLPRAETVRYCASLVELLQHFPQLRYLALGGVLFLQPIPAGQTPEGASGSNGDNEHNIGGPDHDPENDSTDDSADASPEEENGNDHFPLMNSSRVNDTTSSRQAYVNPFHETIDRRSQLGALEALALASSMIGALTEGVPQATVQTIEATYLPHPIVAALHHAFPRARMINLTNLSDIELLAASVPSLALTSDESAAFASSNGSANSSWSGIPSHHRLQPPELDLPLSAHGFGRLLALSTSCQQPISKQTPLHQAAQLLLSNEGVAASSAAAARGLGGAGASRALVTLPHIYPEPLNVLRSGCSSSILSCRAAVDALLRLQSLSSFADVRGTLLERKDGKGGTPLLRAAEAGDAAIVTRLLQAGASLLARNHRDERPLYISCLKGHAEAAVAMIHFHRQSLAEESARSSNDAECNAVACGPDKWTALHAACLSGCLPAVRALLGLDTPDMTTSADAVTPVGAAAGVSSSAEQGLHDSAAVDDGSSFSSRKALSWHNKRSLLVRHDQGDDAVSSSSSSCSSGEKPSSIQHRSSAPQSSAWAVALTSASVTSSGTPRAPCYLQPLVDVTARNRYGRTALHVAVHARSLPIVLLLLEADKRQRQLDRCDRGGRQVGYDGSAGTPESGPGHWPDVTSNGSAAASAGHSRSGVARSSGHQPPLVALIHMRDEACESPRQMAQRLMRVGASSAAGVANWRGARSTSNHDFAAPSVPSSSAAAAVRANAAEASRQALRQIEAALAAAEGETAGHLHGAPTATHQQQPRQRQPQKQRKHKLAGVDVHVDGSARTSSAAGAIVWARPRGQ